MKAEMDGHHGQTGLRRKQSTDRNTEKAIEDSRVPRIGTMTGAARWICLVRRIVIALVIATLLPLPSFADEPQQLEGAAVRALCWAFYAPDGYRWEYSGILVIHDGQLRYSASPNTLKQVDAVEMDAEKQRTPGDTLVGLYT